MDAYRGYRSPNASPPGGGDTWPGASGFVQAAKDMGMTHVWVRLFGDEGKMDRAATARVVEGLRDAGINVAGWGYCHQGSSWKAKGLDWAAEESDHHRLDAFVADVEPNRTLGGTKSRWTQAQLNSYVDGLVQKFGKDNVGISTWPVLKIQNDAASPSLSLMRGVAPKVAMFAPQAYWMKYPTGIHYQETGFSREKYPPDSPEAFARLVVDSWRADGIPNPLVVTGQAYWGENSPPKSVMEGKIATFASSFREWDKIIGFNWWHARGPKAMSDPMVAALIAGKLGDKPFGSP
jgi:hypothetical protein